MNVIADICVIPTTGRTSLREEVARAHAILRDTGLPVTLNAFGTVIEGDYATITAAIQKIHEELHAAGAPRIMTTVKIASRVDKPQSAADKVAAVRAILDAEQG